MMPVSRRMNPARVVRVGHVQRGSFFFEKCIMHSRSGQLHSTFLRCPLLSQHGAVWVPYHAIIVRNYSSYLLRRYLYGLPNDYHLD